MLKKKMEKDKSEMVWNVGMLLIFFLVCQRDQITAVWIYTEVPILPIPNVHFGIDSWFLIDSEKIDFYTSLHKLTCIFFFFIIVEALDLFPN